MTTDRTLVLVSLDTLRGDCVGASPVKLYPEDYPALRPPGTPALDDLARNGAYFANCISAAPYTSASHATYFTGRWPVHHGVYEVYNRGLRSRTLFEIAHARGYRTSFKTDFPLILGKPLGFTRGVDSYFVEDDDAFLESVAGAGPQVAFAHFGGIHYPYGFHNLRYGGDAYRATVAALEEQYPVQDFEFKDKIDETYRSDADRETLLRYKRIVQYLYANERYAELFDLYLRGIEHFLATRFEPFLERLRRILDGRDYLLVVFADHGEQWDADSYGHHNTLNEGVLRVPLILFGPQVTQREHLDRVRTVDLLPTVLQWLGIRAPRSLDGRSLWPIIDTGADPGRETRAFAQAYNCEPDAFTKFQERLLATGRKTGRLPHVLFREAVYDGPYKYLRQHFTYQNGIFGLEEEAREQLYTIAADLRPEPVADRTAVPHLAALLDEYNALRYVGPQAPTTEVLARYLRDFGYHTSVPEPAAPAGAAVTQ